MHCGPGYVTNQDLIFRPQASGPSSELQLFLSEPRSKATSFPTCPQVDEFFERKFNSMISWTQCLIASQYIVEKVEDTPSQTERKSESLFRFRVSQQSGSGMNVEHQESFLSSALPHDPWWPYREPLLVRPATAASGHPQETFEQFSERHVHFFQNTEVLQLLRTRPRFFTLRHRSCSESDAMCRQRRLVISNFSKPPSHLIFLLS